MTAHIANDHCVGIDPTGARPRSAIPMIDRRPRRPLAALRPLHRQQQPGSIDRRPLAAIRPLHGQQQQRRIGRRFLHPPVVSALTCRLRAARRSCPHPARQRVRRRLTRGPCATDDDRSATHPNANSAGGGPDGDRPGNVHRDRSGEPRDPDGRGLPTDPDAPAATPDTRATKCRHPHRRDRDGLRETARRQVGKSARTRVWR